MKSLLVALTLCLLFLGCAKAPPQPSAVEIQANDLLNKTFVAKGEYWFAVEMTHSGPQLHELRHPRSQLIQQDLTDTQRLNGITHRAVVYVTCEQFRTWNGRWSDWRDGEGGGSKEIAVAFLGGSLAHWNANLEQKNGVWNAPKSSSGSGFQQNRALVISLVRQADP